MSKFNRYARELDGAVKAYFERYKAAQQKVKDLDDKIEEVNEDIREFHRTGNADKEWLAKSRLAALQVNRKQAENEFSNVKKGNFEVHKQIKEVRSRLEAECNAAFALDPDAIDPGFFTLLNSGFVKPADFEALWSKAEKAGNVTMLRLIADSAGHEAESQRSKGNYDAASKLNALAAQSRNYSTAGVLDRFDELGFVAKYALGDPQSPQSDRAFPNPVFYDKWDELCSEAIEAF